MSDEIHKNIRRTIQESANIIKDSVQLIPEINKAIIVIIRCIKNGNKIIIFGNGGSAADAQHIAAEFIGRFKMERKSFPAISLTTDTSVITSIANDYSYKLIFSKQCESLVKQGDVVIGISTSGNSKNILEGLKTAKRKKAFAIGLLGKNGGKIKKVVNLAIIVKSSSTPRIQEAHRTIYHIICEEVEIQLARKK